MGVTTQPVFHIAVSRDVAAPPDVVYALITDLTRVGEHSPETVSAWWVEGDSAGVGARFKGRNKLGFMSWSTVSTVIAAERGRLFSFATSAPSHTTWTYTLEATACGTRVTETMRKDGEQLGPIRAMQRLAGVRDRHAHLQAGMTTTLERLAASAEKEI